MIVLPFLFGFCLLLCVDEVDQFASVVFAHSQCWSVVTSGNLTLLFAILGAANSVWKLQCPRDPWYNGMQPGRVRFHRQGKVEFLFPLAFNPFDGLMMNINNNNGNSIGKSFD